VKSPLACIAGFNDVDRYAIYTVMMTVEDIEKAIAQLTAADLDKFRAWYEAFDAQRFDEKIERDIRAGKLDRMADEALAEHRAGRTREL
jgi:hypothetical protein